MSASPKRLACPGQRCGGSRRDHGPRPPRPGRTRPARPRHQRGLRRGRQQPAPTYNADFIELYNPTAGPIDLVGTYVQYRSADGHLRHGLVALPARVAARRPVPGQDERHRRGRRRASRPPDRDRGAGDSSATRRPGPPARRHRAVDPTATSPAPPAIIDMVGLDSRHGEPPATRARARPARRRRTQSASRAPRTTDTDSNVRRLPARGARRPSAAAACAATGTFTRHDRRRSRAPDRHVAARSTTTVTTEGVVTARYPTRWLQRLLHPDRRHGRRPSTRRRRLRRASSSSAAATAAGDPGHRRLRRGDRPGHASSAARPRSRPATADVTDVTPARGRAAHRRWHRWPLAVPDHRPRGPRRPTRASCVAPTDDLHGHQHVRHQHLRRDRPGHRHHPLIAADRGRGRPDRREPSTRRRPTTPPAASCSTTARAQLPATPAAPAVPYLHACRGSPRPTPVAGRCAAATLRRTAWSCDYRNNVWKFQPHSPGDRRRHPGRDLREHPARTRPQRRRRRPQARDLQRAELLPDHG